MTEDWTDSGTDFINNVANLDIPYKPHKIKSLSVEINFHSMVVLVDYKPVKEYILNGDYFPFRRGRIQPRGHLNLERCRTIHVKGNCLANPCRFYTAHKFHRYLKIDRWQTLDDDEEHKYVNNNNITRCMAIDRFECNTGFCLQGRCQVTDFDHDVCDCDNDDTWWVNEKNMMGEYCSIKKKEEVEQIVRWTQGYEIEVNFHENKIEVDLVPNFKDWSWRYYFVRVYEIDYNADGISQTLVHAATSPTEGLPAGIGYSFIFEGALSNTTYLIGTYGRKDLDAQNTKERSFLHTVEVHTPGYSYLPAPTDLKIEPLPGNLFKLSWTYQHELPASEFLINITSPNGVVEQEVATKNHEVLALRSSTSYTIIAASLNVIGDYKFVSAPLQYTTPFFKYDEKTVGHYDFAKWFFKVNTITLDGRFVYFKNPVRRDSRVDRVVLMCSYTNESIEQDSSQNDNSSELYSSVYHAARFNKSYLDHPPLSPYVTASFTTTPLPRRLQIGDRYIYETYLNGELDKEFIYQVYVIVWYTSGQTAEVSVQYVGEIELSKIPWVIIFVSVAVGALVLTILTAIFNCCFYQLVLAHRQKQVEMLRGKMSVRSLLVEDIYMNAILPDPDYDMSKSAEDLGSDTDSAVNSEAAGRDRQSDGSQSEQSNSSVFARQVSLPKRRHTFTRVN